MSQSVAGKYGAHLIATCPGLSHLLKLKTSQQPKHGCVSTLLCGAKTVQVQQSGVCKALLDASQHPHQSTRHNHQGFRPDRGRDVHLIPGDHLLDERQLKPLLDLIQLTGGGDVQVPAAVKEPLSSRHHNSGLG